MIGGTERRLIEQVGSALHSKALIILQRVKRLLVMLLLLLLLRDTVRRTIRSLIIHANEYSKLLNGLFRRLQLTTIDPFDYLTLQQVLYKR